jgi:hypothetical protein
MVQVCLSDRLGAFYGTWREGTEMQNGKRPLVRLESLMMFAAVLSRSEARYAIRDYRAGHDFSGEAVNHYGGIREVLKRALAYRSNETVRGYCREYISDFVVR